MAVDLIRPECPTLDPSEEDGGELELSLGLPVAGNSRRASRSGESAADARTHSSPTAPPLPSLLQVMVADHHPPDSLRRCQAHALRRHEARKKRDEKLQWKGIRRAREGIIPVAAAGVNHELSPVPKQRKQAFDSVPDYRKLIPAPKANTDDDADPNPTVNRNPTLTYPFPVIAMQCPYPPMQYMPIGDGFGVPFMIPSWAPAVSPVTEGPKPATARNVFQPVACRALRPVVEPTNGVSPARSNSGESKDENGTGIERTSSWTASQGSSSSPAASDHRSGSAGSLPTVQPDNHDTSSHQIGPDLGAADEPPERRSTTSGDGPISAAAARGSSTPQRTPQLPPPRPRMPCVSTTGDGPNGKRITGFLYRYTKTEVTIVCVCHGSSFSPAEFVKHAGGTDVAHPLRQITVVSS